MQKWHRTPRTAGQLGRLLDVGVQPNFGQVDSLGLLSNLGAGFSPEQLFANGEQGFWYDPSDLTTLFQNAAGTTPVTAVEQPVRLMLDKSKGLVAGSDLASAWSYTSFNSTRTSNTFPSTVTATSNANFGFFRNGSLEANKYYEFTLAWSGNTAGLTIQVGDGSLNASVGNAISGTVSGRVRVADLPVYIFALAGAIGNSFTVNSFSIRELAGNHATASADARRPVLSARVNQLERTEDFGNAAWQLFASATKSGTAEVAVTFGVLATSCLFQTLTLNAVATHTITFQARSATSKKFRVSLSANLGTPVDAYSADLTTTPDWQTYVVSLVPTATGAGNVAFRNEAAGGVGTVEFRLPDLRVTNDGVGLPVYQRVTTATDYDTTNFPRYLRFDGTDDCLFTGNIDFASGPTNPPLGPDVIVNGTFDTDTTGWTVVNGTFVASGGQGIAEAAASIAGIATQSFTTVAGRTYQLQLTGIALTANPVIRIGTSSNNDSILANTTVIGSSSRYFVATTTTTWLTLRTSSSVTGNQAAFDNITVREITDPALGTDKVTVCAGVRKLSDAATAMVYEFTADLNANTGAFYMAARYAATPADAFSLKGTIPTIGGVASFPVTAPVTYIGAHSGDIATDTSIARVNGAQVATSAVDLGTGTLNNRPLYIGARNDSTLRFNGRIYQLIGRGALSDAVDLANTEAYVNDRTRAY